MKTAFPLKIFAVLSFALATLFSGCGGVGSNSAFSAKCELACRFDSSAASCNDNDSPQRCKQDCEVVTAGLPTQCAQCVVDHIDSDLSEVFRSDGGTGNSMCYRYSIPAPTGGYCKEYCLFTDGGR